MMVFLALACAIAGFACLAIAMDRHARLMPGPLPRPARKAGLRSAGAIGIAAAYAFIAADMGWIMGTIAWFGLVSAGAAVVVLTLSAWESAR